MIPLLADENRMVDVGGQPLEWRGRWIYASPLTEAILPPLLPATYPRTYWKERVNR